MDKPRKVTRILLVAEFPGDRTDGQVQHQLDAFREAALPAVHHGITLYRPPAADLAAFGGATAWAAAAVERGPIVGPAGAVTDNAAPPTPPTRTIEAVDRRRARLEQAMEAALATLRRAWRLEPAHTPAPLLREDLVAAVQAALPDAAISADEVLTALEFLVLEGFVTVSDNAGRHALDRCGYIYLPDTEDV